MNFSYLELIIALIIISTITIITLNLKNLKNNSKSILFIAEIGELENNISRFKQKYNFYPGDFPFAQQYFLNDKNGNGDGLIKDDNESLFAWKHLKLAQIIRLNFKPTELKYAKIDINMLPSKYNLCGYQILADKKLNNINHIFKEKANFLRIAKDKGVGNLSHSCLDSSLSYFIDKKIDDAKPLSGKVFADIGHEFWQEKNKCICKKNNMLSYCNYRENLSCFLQIKI